MKYSVKPLREAGLEARWSKTRRGQPVIIARNPSSDLKHQREKWWYVDVKMWELFQKEGILKGFDLSTLLGDIFAIDGL